ncbi:hypothetical protein KUTeg_004950 [Tegillarca granosa]|uniref:Domain of unknown function with conserved HDNR motif domain-containing protein n=1 Tax=Tegillarca granosa TaxID=220873 RepID=A0ABQ9FIC6_TEGGR|nr:hypothetical protein KUTeg_004950 [Tegillarca granosa]
MERGLIHLYRYDTRLSLRKLKETNGTYTRLKQYTGIWFYLLERLCNQDRSLGRKIILPDLRLHHTEKEFLKHHGKTVVDRDLHTTYGTSFTGNQTTSAPVYRRFAKVYKQPSGGAVKLDTTTTDQFKSPDVPYRTPTHVLAISQEPFLKHNAWKYSNHGLRKIYPPYDRKNEPLVNNEFNRYGAAFTV